MARRPGTTPSSRDPPKIWNPWRHQIAVQAFLIHLDVRGLQQFKRKKEKPTCPDPGFFSKKNMEGWLAQISWLFHDLGVEEIRGNFSDTHESWVAPELMTGLLRLHSPTEYRELREKRSPKEERRLWL
jgi:hypothetical protein